jgi:hypothetical protein
MPHDKTPGEMICLLIGGKLMIQIRGYGIQSSEKTKREQALTDT